MTAAPSRQVGQGLRPTSAWRAGESRVLFRFGAPQRDGDHARFDRVRALEAGLEAVEPVERAREAGGWHRPLQAARACSRR